MCIDRPCITYREIVEECLAGAGVEVSNESDYDPDDVAFSVRGFVMEWPEDVVDSLLDWQECVSDEIATEGEEPYEQLTFFDAADGTAVGNDGEDSEAKENKEE